MTDTRHLDTAIDIFKSGKAKRGRGSMFTYYGDTQTLQGPRGKTVLHPCTEEQARRHVARIAGATLTVF